VTHKDDATVQTSAAEFILEGLWAHKRISRSEERGFFADARRTQEPRDPREPSGGRMPRRQFN
jgi:magnesium chelatase subunit I